jgi:hypothetical protein
VTLPTASPARNLQNFSNNLTMDFYAALKKVLEGHKVSRLEWIKNDVMYLSEPDEKKDRTLYVTFDGEPHMFIVREVDIVATDWYIV